MQCEERVDLHTHSSCSDGLLSPGELVEKAAIRGLLAVGLTDHDTLAGLQEAFEASRRTGTDLVPGVEVSALFNEEEFHLLGYYPALPADLEQALQEFKQERYLRMEEMIQRLQNLHFRVSLTEVLEEAAPAAPGRLHLARILQRKGYVSSLQEAFSLYLGRGRPGYASRRLPQAEKALGLLKDCGALPVLAHPGAGGEIVIAALAPLGLRGLEVFHPDHSQALTKKYLRLARECNLLITGGSDCHGEKGNRDLLPPEHSIVASYYYTLREAAGV